jgi:choline dehydrogenase-like flavoprotein
MKKAIIIGSKAGGVTAAKELAKNFEVTILEAGKEFRPFPGNLALLGQIKKSGLFFHPALIQLLFPAMQIRTAADGMILVNGNGTGGTTTLNTGSAVRADAGLKRFGINLDEEFSEIYREIPITTGHSRRWSRVTHRLFEIFKEL